MNKVDKIISNIHQRNFLTFFILTIISLFVAIFSIIGISFLNPKINRNIFIGIIILIVLTIIIVFFSIFSFFAIYKERNSLQHQKLLKIIFW
ncbi:Uncharacterised protein, partial [Metamycoplasma alkalescens]